jgi:predicted enzyme related to lactoylglutathione lyase
VGGCITHGNGNKPNVEGALVYLNGGEDLGKPLARVEKAGGKVILPKTSIGENGFMAVFTDTEGNRVAFHSMS